MRIARLLQWRRYGHVWRYYRAQQELRLTRFSPRSTLEVEEHPIGRARFTAIDAHNHLGRWLSPNHEWVCSNVPALIKVLDAVNIQTICNLDGMWGDELEANLDRYDRAYPGRFVTFAQSDWRLVTGPDFGAKMARRLEDSVRRGARGLKVWKTLGLRYRDAQRRLIPIDDKRLADLWDAAADLHVPVLIHVADPVAFFRPLDRFNERWEELRTHPNWQFHGPGFPSFATLMEQFEQLVGSHPRTTFIGAHVGCYAENLGWVTRMLDTYPNFHVDISARLAELGRQPYSSRRLFERHPDRILFGLDIFPPAEGAYAAYFRFLETADEYFSYSRREVGHQGRWNIYGIDLADEILRRVYYQNAARLILRIAETDPQP